MRNRVVTYRTGRGLTLIEVVASVALLGLLLVSIITAKARHTHQWALADRKRQAVAALDGLLTHWWQEPQELPRDGQGTIEGLDEAQWRIVPVEHEQLGQFGAQVLRLEIWGTRSGEEERPLAAVELVLPEPPKEPKETHAKATDKTAQS